MSLKELLNFLESQVPPAYQEPYDNSGMQVGDPDAAVSSVLLSLDVTGDVIDEAASLGCELIISHHPLIFKPLKSICGRTAAEKLVMKAIRKNIAVYSMHTNLDIINGGVSYRMAKMLGLTNINVLSPLDNKLLKLVVFVPGSHAGQLRNAIFDAGAGYIGNYDRCSYNVHGEGTYRPGAGTDPYSGEQGEDHTEAEIRIETVVPEHLKSRVVKAMMAAHPYEEVAYDIYKIENAVPGAGLGCVGDAGEGMDDVDFIKLLSEVFGAKGIRHTALENKKIKRVAVMGGSGGAYIAKAVSSGADAFVTGDIKYHDFLEAEGILLADIGHYESEKPAMEILHEIITKKFPKFAVRFSEKNTNPVNYLQAWKK